MVSLPLRTSLMLGLLLHMVGADFLSGLQYLCGNMMARPVTYKVQILCEDISSFLEQLNKENELERYGLLPTIRNSRDTSSAESALTSQDASVRTRRGGNYIRFGRSVPSTSYANSFGQRDTRGDGHYVRFGRSLPDLPQTENLLHKIVSTAQQADEMEEEKEKRFMRFGRDPESGTEKEEDKRFMRFGKKDAGMGNGSKRFMRFGKREDEANTLHEEEKRFMRFGRKDGEMSPAGDKRFMRFGKRFGDDLGKLDYETSGKRFMRFGKRTQEDIDEKRFMRFGKREGEDEKSEDKRFMRFGKRFMRFGRIPSDSQNNPIEPKDISDEKRFMRFGKKSNVDDLDTVLDSSLPNDNIKGSDDKRFMRFGKKSDTINTKRFMRFGKRSNVST